MIAEKQETRSCPALHEVLVRRMPQRWGSEADYAQLPSKGIYFFYEQGETCEGHGPEGLRIVYVGTVRAENRMPKRIPSHYRRNSSFRGHIGRVFLARKHADHLDYKVDGESVQSIIRGGQSADFPRDVKRRLNDYFRSNMSFRFIPLRDDTLRENLEERLIATVAACSACGPSPTWLGHSSLEDKIRGGKLWNVNHVDSLRRVNVEEVLNLFNAL